MRLLDIACGPAWACELLPGGVGFGFFRAYLVVGHVFFDDHFEFETSREAWSCRYGNITLEGAG